MLVYINLLILLVVVGVQAQDGVGTQPLLVFGDFRTKSVRLTRTTGYDVTTEIPDGSTEYPDDIAYDKDSKTIYVIDRSNVTIKSFILGDPLSLRVVINLPNINGVYKGIAFDRVRNQLFVCESLDIIYRLSTDGTGFIDWIRVNSPNDVAVHSDQGWLYWSESWKRRIMRSPVTDPTFVEVIAETDRAPNGLFIDEQYNKVYWCEFHGNRIEEASLDGGNRKLLIQLTQKGIITDHLTVLNGHVFVTVTYEGRGRIFDVYNGSFTDIYFRPIVTITPTGIVAIQDVTADYKSINMNIMIL